MSSDDFVTYLDKEHPCRIPNGWDHYLDQIKKIVAVTLQTATENAEISKSNCFEFFGFDFVIDESMKCWLIEANMSPACAERSPWLIDMLDDMAEGMLSIVEKKMLLSGHYIGNLQTKAEELKTTNVVASTNWVKVYDSREKMPKKSGLLYSSP